MWPDIDPVAGLCHRSTSAGIHNTARSSWVQFRAGAGPYCVGTACAPVVLFSLTVQQGKKWILWSVLLHCLKSGAGSQVPCWLLTAPPGSVECREQESPCWYGLGDLFLFWSWILLCLVATSYFPFHLCSHWNVSLLCFCVADLFLEVFWFVLYHFGFVFPFMLPVCVACPFVTWNIDFGPRSSALKINFCSFTCLPVFFSWHFLRCG